MKITKKNKKWNEKITFFLLFCDKQFELIEMKAIKYLF